MGSCYSTNGNTRYIEQKLKESEDHEKATTKMLFLGPGGSGKSTIFKQLQYINDGGFTKEDANGLTQHIHTQTVRQMQTAITIYLSEKVDDNLLQKEIDKVDKYTIPRRGTVLTQDIAESIQFIWQNDVRLDGIFETYSLSQIEPSTEHFWTSIDRISADDYIPNREDIINVRYRTTGVVQKRFSIKERHFHVFDVGGQISERKKWVNCFDDVNAVIFVASLACYNQLMYEDNKTNCMVDAITLFDKTINNDFFKETPIILFLNKEDLFEKKIKTIPITVCPALEDFKFVSERNEDCFAESAAFIEKRFEERNKSRREMYTHLTCAVDDKIIESVFSDVVKMIVAKIANRMTDRNLF